MALSGATLLGISQKTKSIRLTKEHLAGRLPGLYHLGEELPAETDFSFTPGGVSVENEGEVYTSVSTETRADRQRWPGRACGTASVDYPSPARGSWNANVLTARGP
ncbi:MAG TPA: hypothetical protein VI750_07185, partial [Pyrinomonadaceae bacterium]|nr:hypothetical protein [Pyrinomonadaceae bacterium]